MHSTYLFPLTQKRAFNLRTLPSGNLLHRKPKWMGELSSNLPLKLLSKHLFECFQFIFSSTPVDIPVWAVHCLFLREVVLCICFQSKRHRWPLFNNLFSESMESWVKFRKRLQELDIEWRVSWLIFHASELSNCWFRIAPDTFCFGCPEWEVAHWSPKSWWYPLLLLAQWMVAHLMQLPLERTFHLVQERFLHDHSVPTCMAMGQ